MKILADSPERFLATELGAFIPDLTHIGSSRMVKARPPLAEHSHRGAIEIVYVRRGQIRYEVKGRSWLVKGGDVFLTFPHEIHGTGELPEERVALYWIGVDLDTRSSRFLGLKSKESLALRKALREIRTRQFKAPPVLAQHIADIIELLRSNLPYRKIAAQGTLIQLLTTLLRTEKQGRENPYSSVVIQAMQLIETRIEDTIALQELADACHLSLSHFKKIFRRETGTPPYEYIMRLKMDRAKNLLKNPDRTVTEIAFQLGFPSSQHFATLFKKMTAVTPTEFRHASPRRTGSFSIQGKTPVLPRRNQ